jgi:transcriptional regulator with XRE-family HTH domain
MAKTHGVAAIPRRVQVLAIRRRDGNGCVVCHIDEQTHEKRYGQTLNVHRIVPGSDYSTEWGKCVTLCDVCHDALHGKGHWGWIGSDDPGNDEQLARVRQSSCRDLNEEENWRKREAWGAWVKTLRLAKLSSLVPKRKSGAPVRRCRSVSPLARFARLSGLSTNTLLDFEAGRREPLLFEAKKLSTALGISLDGLATEKEPADGWRALCEERSRRRALVLRAREPQEGEIETLSRAAKLVWDVVGRAGLRERKGKRTQLDSTNGK